MLCGCLGGKCGVDKLGLYIVGRALALEVMMELV